MLAEYEYTKDLLTKITTMVTYTYTDDVYRRLKKLDYGNDDSVEYEYDDLGRVIKETYYKDGKG